MTIQPDITPRFQSDSNASAKIMGVQLPALSILIPTLGRDAVLWDTLDALLPQLSDSDEILIVDQNSGILDVPARFKRAPVRFLRLTPPSLTQARNAALSDARSEYCLFLDDDIIPRSNLLNQWREAIRLWPGHILAGAVEQEDTASLGTISDSSDRTARVNLDDGSILTNFNFGTEGPVNFFPGGHVLIPRSCLPPKPFFCPYFRGNAQGEEIDFALRVHRLGIGIMGIPQARIYHLKSPSGGCRDPEFRRAFPAHQIFNEGLFFGRNGNLLQGLKFLRRIKALTEYRTRRIGFPAHSPFGIVRAGWNLVLGLGMGMISRDTRRRIKTNPP